MPTDPPHTVPHVYTGTRLQPVTTNTSTNNSPLLSSHGYTGVGSTTYTDPSIGLTEISISHDSTPRPEATAPPPSYEEVLNTDMYPHGQIDSQRVCINTDMYPYGHIDSQRVCINTDMYPYGQIDSQRVSLNTDMYRHRQIDSQRVSLNTDMYRHRQNWGNTPDMTS